MTTEEKNALCLEAKRLVKVGKKLVSQYNYYVAQRCLLSDDQYCDDMGLVYLTKEQARKEVAYTITDLERQIESTTHQLETITRLIS